MIDDASMNTEAAAIELLKDYYSAFSTLDLKAILSFFQTPAFLIGPIGAAPALSTAELEAIITRSIEDLRRRNYGHSEFIVGSAYALGAASTLVRGIAVRFDTDGQELERLGISYLLQWTNAGWKIAVMIFEAGASS